MFESTLHARLTVLQVVEQTEDAEEQIDEVEIKADSPHNVFVRGKLGVDDISIVNDVAGEEQAAPDRVDEVHGLVEGDDHPHKPSHAESDQTAEQPRAHSFEIIFGLEGEQRQSDEDAERDQKCLKDNNIIVEGNHHTQSKCFHGGECGEQNKVPWVRVALPVKETEVNECAE